MFTNNEIRVASPPPPRTPPICGCTFICCAQPVIKITEHKHVAHTLTSLFTFTKVNFTHTHTHTTHRLFTHNTAEHRYNRPYFFLMIQYHTNKQTNKHTHKQQTHNTYQFGMCYVSIKFPIQQ